ncbi:MAG TPA: sulfite exporter TauE/SafE family protein [Gemmatimonadaceae bacterium]
MSPLLIPTALALGALHSFAPDHLAAVSVFVSRRPSWRHALGLGARWGMGHSLTVVLVGGTLAVLGLRLPARFSPLVERAVGVTLIVLGVLAVARAARLHGHWHQHGGDRHWHVHSHLRGESHEHDHRALLGIGMLHGLAGTGALVVALPVAIAGSAPAALVFLAAFGVGTIVSMALFGAAAGWLLGATTRVSGWVHGVAVSVAGAISVGVGVWWLIAGG